MDMGILDTVNAEASTVMVPHNVAGDTVKAAKSGLESSGSRRFMASSYKQKPLCAVGGDGKNVGVDLSLGR
jgi:hypothetical protein